MVQVIGAPDSSALYAKAITACGGYAERHDGEAVAHGMALSPSTLDGIERIIRCAVT